MTLDEAIKHCEEVAEENEKISLYTPVEFITADLSIEQCQNCAAEHRQLAEWLKDYKRMKEQEPRWIPVSERVAEFPCLACDIFEQIFIPIGIVVLNSRCYEGKDFAFNVEKFLKGKEVILFGGEKVYEPPREIVAWMPLPAPFEPQESEDKE